MAQGCCFPSPLTARLASSPPATAAETFGSFETLAPVFQPVRIGVVNPQGLSAARGREFRPRRPKRLSERLTARYREAAASDRKCLPQLALGAEISP